MAKLVRPLNLILACGSLLIFALLGIGALSREDLSKLTQSSWNYLQDLSAQVSSLSAATISPALAAPIQDAQRNPSMWNCSGTFTNEPNALNCDEIPVTEIKDRKGNKFITKQWGR